MSVFPRFRLLHFSMLPTFVVYNRNNMTVNGNEKKAQHMRFSRNEAIDTPPYFSLTGKFS